jgi:hypothetical protein
MWGPRWADHEAGAEDRRLYLPAGSAVLMDYRTVHRGTINFGMEPRPVAMLIYGREWW